MFVLRCYKHTFAHLHYQQFQCVILFFSSSDKQNKFMQMKDSESSGLDEIIMIHSNEVKKTLTDNRRIY